MFIPLVHGQNRNGAKKEYGSLYNWFVVENDSLNLITGLHVPDIDETHTLASYLGGISIAGGKLKEIGFYNWLSPNTGATNEVNFTALPGGFRSKHGTFEGVGEVFNFWTTTREPLIELADNRRIYDNSAELDWWGDEFELGYNIRCMRELTAGEQSSYSDGDIVEYKLDYDDNFYAIIKIGTQGWIHMNLKTTHYLNGIAIPNITNDTIWQNIRAPARCTYNNE
jgi:uncharacterized protein (TIGR02145 family)